NGTGTFGTASLTTGAHNITAAYLGDNNFNAFTTSPALVQTVTAGNTNITLSASNLNPPMNSAVVFTFTVTGGSAPPQGTITMSDSITGAPVNLGECSGLNVVASPAPPVNTSTVTCTVNYDNSNAQHGAGVHQLVATFASANT